MEVLFVLDPPERLDPDADSTYAMVQEAQRRGHATFGCLLEDLHLWGGQARAHAAPLLSRPVPGDAPARLELAPSRARPLGEFDVVLMRKDPPVDESYLTATWILERASSDTRVLNDPRGLRDLNEKLSMLDFPGLVPPTRVLRRIADLRSTLTELGGKMIVKPVFGFGGREVLQARADDPNLSTVLELATDHEHRWTIAQAFLDEAREGDKRILLLDGEPVGAVLRVPAPGELRNNFHAGGKPRATTLTDRDLEICAAVGAALRRAGQYFAGIDVIGGWLTEINVTSPTGMQEINRLGGLREDQTMQALFWSGIEHPRPA